MNSRKSSRELIRSDCKVVSPARSSSKNNRRSAWSREMITALEPRMLLDSLTVGGTGGDDTIDVFWQNNALGTPTYYASVNGSLNSVGPAGGANLAINAGDGNNQINVVSVFNGSEVTVNGGSGADTVVVGNGNFTTDIQGYVDTNLGTGAAGTNDSVTINDSNKGGTHSTLLIEYPGISSNNGSGGIWGSVRILTAPKIVVNCSDADDTINCDSAISGTTVNLGGGVNNVHFGDFYEDFFQTTAPSMTFNGGVNTDTCTFDDSGDTTNPGRTYSVSKAAALGQTLNNFENLIIDTRTATFAQPNTLNITGIPLNSFGGLTINGGANNVTNFGSSFSSVDLSLTGGTMVLNDTGVKNFYVDDNNKGSDYVYYLLNENNSQEVLSRYDNGTTFSATFAHPPNLTLDTGSSADLIFVEQTISGSVIQLNGGDGNDSFDVGGITQNIEGNILGNLNINGDAGTDSIQIEDELGVTGAGHTNYNLEPNCLIKGGVVRLSWSPSDVEHLTLNLPNQNNVVSFQLDSLQSATLEGNNGNDSFTNVGPGSSHGSLTTYPGDAIIEGAGGTDTLTIDDTADNSTSSYSFEFGGFYYSSATTSGNMDYSIENFNLNENNSSTATTHADLKPAALNLTINGGTGAGSFEFGGGDLSANGFINTTVTGGGGNDSLDLNDSAHPYNSSQTDSYNLYLNEFAKYDGSTADVKFFSFPNIAVDLSGVNDTQTRTNLATIYDIASGVNVAVNGGARIDNINVALGDTGDLHATSSNPLTLSGLSAGDSVTVNDNLNSDPRTYAINPTSFSITTSTGAGLAMNYPGGSGSFVLNCGDGSDTVLLPSTSVPVAINGNGGNNTYELGGGNLANLTARVTVNGGSGADNLIYDDSLDAIATTQTFAATSFTVGAVAHSVNNVAFTTILAGPGGDTLKINKNVRSLTFTGNTGKDIVTIGNGDYDANIQEGSISVNGGGGTADTVTIDDRSDTGAAYSFIGNVFRHGASNTPPVTINNFQTVALLANSLNDQITIQSALPIVANGEAGADTFDLESTGTGIFTVNPNATIEGGAGSDIVTVNTTATNGGSATASFVTTEDLASLTIGANGNAVAVAGSHLVLNTKALTFNAASSKLDLNDNDLLLDYSSATPLSTINSDIKTGRANGAWTGNLITSSMAKSNTKHMTTLGAMEATDYKSIYGTSATYDGQTIDNTAVLVKYTYYGDANFSGSVDGGDYARADLTFAHEVTQGNLGGWINGDFDGDGRVNGSDYGLADLAFGAQDAPLNPPPAFPSLQSSSNHTGGASQSLGGLVFD